MNTMKKIEPVRIHPAKLKPSLIACVFLFSSAKRKLDLVMSLNARLSRLA